MNAPALVLSAEDVWQVYRPRWEVETFFKLAKSGCGLAKLPSSNKHTVDALVDAAVIRATLAMRVKRKFTTAVPAASTARLNPLQWVRWWNRQLDRLLDTLIDVDLRLDKAALIRISRDPNRSRLPTRAASSAI